MSCEMWIIKIQFELGLDRREEKKTRQDKRREEKTTQDEMRLEKRRQYNEREDKEREEKRREGKGRQIRQEKTREDKMLPLTMFLFFSFVCMVPKITHSNKFVPQVEQLDDKSNGYCVVEL